MRRLMLGSVLVSLLLAACSGSSGGSGTPEPSRPPASGGGTDGGTDGIEHPTGSEPILIVDSAGGFVPVGFMATRVPTFVLLGDGRIIMQGAQTLQFPGPALPPLIERTLTEKGIQAVLEAIEDTNLFTSDLELRGAQNIVADASDTIFIVNAGGQQATVTVYGLGAIPPDMQAPPGMTSGEIEAHRILGRLNEGLLTIDSWLPADAWEAEGWQPYEPEAFRLYVRETTGEQVEGGDLPEQVRVWPTADNPAAFGAEETFFGDGTRCGVVDGDLGVTWLEELSAATQLTRWTDDGGERRFSILPRPLLPHEDPACPELAGAA